ncbi:hypothetical protein IFM58399_10150 [Aspergillus lentulus]|uniref:uncharacterized protein n=1 Tax=Aspergillus lentulus TaxID=293939 RepID=UPI001393547E|nr:uncharacterized protein IFM58399_10150 [Aspergillus lentulus]KAF4154166.1 hypothetical protein CNMCM6069_009594 [Aspergillus lentulus]KAF4167119.1 hypothetical protein CNMCM6936_005647 [Aspergillus lentulus]GFF55545.1 hypothetical protein IFM62136_02873 [Aspergillus lentulus]GFF55751.1 hypothetical protein IFM58399_10150 [Aspergillus lentulus]GFF81333.1 hypothetical protein IFM47457_05431 [Aspergillus lentulus]
MFQIFLDGNVLPWPVSIADPRSSHISGSPPASQDFWIVFMGRQQWAINTVGHLIFDGLRTFGWWGFKLEQLGILKAEDIPKVAATHSIQGKESQLVIYDWVISAPARCQILGSRWMITAECGLARVTEAMLELLLWLNGRGDFQQVYTLAGVILSRS